MNNQTTTTTNILAASLLLPTVSNGELKRGTWTTKGAELLTSGSLDATLKGDAIEYMLDGMIYSVSSGVVAARALYEALKGDLPVKTLLETMSNGFLSIAQANVLVDDRKKGKKEILPTADSRRVLTSDEYLHNCVKLAEPDLISFFDKAQTVSEKSTKAELLSLIESLTSQLVTAQELSQFESIKLAEEQEALKYKALTDLGITEIRKGSTGLINCRCTFQVMGDNLQSKLTAIGYTMKEGLQMVDGLVAFQIVEGQTTL